MRTTIILQKNRRTRLSTLSTLSLSSSSIIPTEKMSPGNDNLFVPADDNRPQFAIKFSAGEFNEEIESAEQLIECLKKLPEHQVYDTAKDYFEVFCDRGKEFLDSIGIDLYEFVRDGEYWQGHDTPEEFESAWLAAKKALDRRESDNHYLQTVFNGAIQLWPHDAQKIMVRAQTKTFAEKISKFITGNISFETMQLAVNNAILKRLENSLQGRGIRRAKSVMQGDLDNARKQMDLTPLTEERLARFNLALDEDGFCCEYGRGVRSLATPMSMPNTPSSDSGRQLRPRGDKRKTYQPDDSQEEELTPSKKPKPTVPTNSSYAPCGCYADQSKLTKFLTKVDGKTEREALQIFRIIGRQIRSHSAIDVDNICTDHARNLCKLLHLYANGTHAEMAHRINVLYSRSGEWDTLKKEYEQWFKPTSGKEIITCFRFEPRPQMPLVADFARLNLSLEDLSLRCFGTIDKSFVRQKSLEWKRDGSVVLPLFRWLSEDWDGQHPDGLLSMISEEIDMYDWHYRPRRHAPRVGWAKNMWFSLIQQLVRQDPCYYMFYVFYRPDHLWRLISFPYYAKSTYLGEKTAFRHIDINVNDLLNSKRCANAIQGSITVKDEDQQNCTESLLGMHHHLGTWWKDLKDRECCKDGLIHKVTSDMWKPADEQKFGLTWKRQICRAGDVRISLPHLPHGSTGPATMNRRTILPWFVGIREDHETLECIESGSWTELSNCHRDFTSPEKTPSGWSSAKYGGRLQHAFAATVRLSDLGSASDALVGRGRWDSPNVIQELDILFSADSNLAFQHIEAWRTNVRVRYEQAFRLLVETEKAIFGSNSFFARKERGLSVRPCFCDSDGVVVGAEAENQEDGSDEVDVSANVD